MRRNEGLYNYIAVYVAPRQGHLDRLKQMDGYLRKYASAAIRVRMEEPDFS
jgi:hypothetical protein